ncbi:MAG: Rha family transcriptional regulator [Pseudobacteriovorax sp.]|nr:Rha family transcriptional regulator [Pseudobacteriovorax sp.]
MTEMIPTDSVLIKNDVPITTSLTIAEVFDKEHKNILRAIRKILPNIQESWAALNFERSEYRDENESRVQATLLRQGLGSIKKYISNLPLGFSCPLKTLNAPSAF